ncbi:hypothetical protein FXB74_10330, partial [Aggregatibacter actinomycetemcomitans]
DIVCKVYSGFCGLNYTKLLCRLFFILERSTRPIKELHLNWLVVVSNFWGADQSAVDLQDVFTHYTS